MPKINITPFYHKFDAKYFFILNNFFGKSVFSEENVKNRSGGSLSVLLTFGQVPYTFS